jgi:hypothetical protein
MITFAPLATFDFLHVIESNFYSRGAFIFLKKQCTVFARSTISGISLEGLRRTIGNLNQYSWSLVRNFSSIEH